MKAFTKPRVFTKPKSEKPKVKPKGQSGFSTHAEICPVCKGSGNTRKKNKASNEGPRDCHGCGGKGWVEVSDDNAC